MTSTSQNAENSSPADRADELLPLMYDELKRIAAAKMMSEQSGHTLQATALVHEVYMRLREQTNQQQWQGPDHFLAVAAEAMRRILVEHARRKLSVKRGGQYSRLSLESLTVKLPMDPTDLLAVHEALDRLAEEDPLAAELVKLRIFGRFSHASAAEQLEIPVSKAKHVWAYAKARLYVLMEGSAH